MTQAWWGARATVGFVALAVALALIAAAPPTQAQDNGAGPWPQVDGDPGHTRQAGATGPDDPGVKWFVDLEDVVTDDASEGYSIGNDIRRFSTLNQPTIAPNGLLLLRAFNNAEEYRALIALDPDDGSVVWEVPDIVGSCAQTIDSRGWVWVIRRDVPFALEAFDHTDGSPIPGTRIDGVNPCTDSQLQVGGDDEHLVVIRRRDWGIEVYDISGPVPMPAWTIDPDEDDNAVFDELIRPSYHPVHVLFTDDTLLLAARTEDNDVWTPELFELSLADGTVVDRLTLPVTSQEGEEADGRDFDQVRMLMPDDDTVILGVFTRFGDAIGYLARVDLDTGLDLAWTAETGTPQMPDRQNVGPQEMALGDGVVVVESTFRRHVSAHSLADGSEVWESFALGGRNGSLLTDADGAVYTTTETFDDPSVSTLGSVHPDGSARWIIPRGAIENDQNLDDDLGPERYYGPIDTDGTLYVTWRIGAEVLALDNSGGLADFAPDDDLPEVPDRVSGADRFETAAGLSQAAFAPGVDRVYVATGQDFPDALTGGVAAAINGAPVLLVRLRSIPDPTAAELDRLDPGEIVVLGGEAAVGPEVFSALGQYTDGTVRRIAGEQRFETARRIAEDTFAPEATNVAYVATGLNFPDALAGVPPAAAWGGPILLTASRALPADTRAELARLNVDRVFVLGGPGVITNDVIAELGEFADDVTRVAGPDRFGTAVDVGGLVTGQDPPRPLWVFVATGVTFPDALAGGAVAGAIPGPIMLVGRDFTPEVVTDELARLQPDRLIILGGTNAVSAANEQRLRDAAGL